VALIPKSFIEEVLARTDIVEVVGRRVPLKKKGAEFAACCPFHEEKTPSFYVSPAKQFYHCFGCGAHGSALTFLMEHERMDFRAALEELAREAGLELPRDEAASRPEPHRPLYDILQEASAFYASQLLASPAAVAYFKERNVQGGTADAFQLGYAPGGNRLLATLGSSPERIRLLIQTGLVIEKDDGDRYDRFRNRVMYPIRDRRGRVLGFGGRLIGPGEPKYLNSPETPVFHKGQGVYGLYEARRHDARPGALIVVEGYMDVIMLAQAGIHNVVATLGTATTEAQIQLLYRLSPTLIFCFDGDKAGRKAAWRALEVSLPLLEDGRDLRFVFLPEGEDPDSFVQQHGRTGLEDFITGNGLSLDQYFWRSLAERHPGEDAPSLARMAEDARSLLRRIPPGTIKSLLNQRLRARLGHAAPVTRSTGPYRRGPAQPMQPMPRRIADALDLVCAIWLRHPTLAERHPLPAVLTDMPPTNFLVPLQALCAQHRDKEAWAAIPDAERRARLQRLRMPGIDDPVQAEAILDDAFGRLVEHQHTQRERASINLALSQFEKNRSRPK